MAPIEARQVTVGIAPGAFAAEIEIDMEIAQSEFAQRPIHRLTITAADKVGFRDRPPMSARFENGEDMVGILVRFEIQDQRWKSEDSQCSRGERGAFEAMRGLFP